MKKIKVLLTVLALVTVLKIADYSNYKNSLIGQHGQ